MTPHQLFFEGINYVITDYPSDVQLSPITVDVASMAGDHVRAANTPESEKLQVNTYAPLT